MNTPRDQSSQSEVPRRHGPPAEGLRLKTASPIPPYRAISATGKGMAALAAANALGISLPNAGPSTVVVATVGQVVTNAAWNWTVPGAVNYSAGLLTQGAGTLLGQAISPTQVLVTL